MKNYLMIMILFIIAILLVIFFDKDDNYVKNGNLYISEIVASNSYTYKNEDLEYDDYIEIYNGNNYTINLSNYRLTDSIYESNKWQFPDIEIDAYEYLLIFPSGKNKCESKLNCHTNYKLKKDGETVSLIDKEGNILSQVTYKDLHSDESISYIESKYVVTIPTPGEENVLKKMEDKNYTIYINEYLSHNKNFNYSSNGGSYDFVELYNYGDDDVNLSGLSLSDNPDNLNKYLFPEKIIKAHEYLVIYLTDGVEIDNYLYANFKLSDNDKNLILSKASKIIDKVEIVKLDKNMSYGKVNDKWYYFYNPTPGKENNTKKVERLENGNS